MQIEELALSSIKPYERNPRRNDSAVKGVAESIRQFGFQQPIVIDNAGIIVAGHTRYKAAKLLGMSTVPCVRADNLTKEQVKAYRILDNKLNELATWDFETLSKETSSFEFDFGDFEVQLPTFNIDEIDAAPFDGHAQPTPQTANTSPTVSEGSVAGGLNNIPETLKAVDLTPIELPPIVGDNATKFERVIIVYPQEQKEDVARLLGIETLSKVLYTFKELCEQRGNG